MVIANKGKISATFFTYKSCLKGEEEKGHDNTLGQADLGIRTRKGPDSEAHRCLGTRKEMSGYPGLGLAIQTRVRIPVQVGVSLSDTQTFKLPITEKSTFLGFCAKEVQFAFLKPTHSYQCCTSVFTYLLLF